MESFPIVAKSFPDLFARIAEREKREEHDRYTRLDAILDKQTERGIEENDPLADALERKLGGPESGDIRERNAQIESEHQNV